MGLGGIVGGEGGTGAFSAGKGGAAGVGICRLDGSLGVFRMGIWVALGREGLGQIGIGMVWLERGELLVHYGCR